MAGQEALGAEVAAQGELLALLLALQGPFLEP